MVNPEFGKCQLVIGFLMQFGQSLFVITICPSSIDRRRASASVVNLFFKRPFFKFENIFFQHEAQLKLIKQFAPMNIWVRRADIYEMFTQIFFKMTPTHRSHLLLNSKCFKYLLLEYCNDYVILNIQHDTFLVNLYIFFFRLYSSCQNLVFV